MAKHPQIIQGGMGIGVSNWCLAKAVSQTGQMGVVSGTGIDNLVIRRLQSGDVDGSVRRALGKFPFPNIAAKILERYFVEGGLPAGKPFANAPAISAKMSKWHQQLLAATNFVEVYLAKEGHSGVVGINLLEKVQMAILPSLYGAMLAGVDYVLMGAGIPKEVPNVLNHFAEHKEVTYKLAVNGALSTDDFKLTFSPREFSKDSESVQPYIESEVYSKNLKRPIFLAIIASNVLAVSLTKKATVPVDGFIIEAPTAGGHNAPPRGKLQLSETGEPIYGPRDDVDFALIKEIGLPFWLAGSVASHEGLLKAQSFGAVGIQVGTAFALCEDSGFTPENRNKVLAKVIETKVNVFTDPLASPTGFPFKVAQMENSISEEAVYKARTRVCDLGYLRDVYKGEDGNLIYRCASEPVDTFLKRGGSIEETVGRKCLCNGLMATVGFGQRKAAGIVENPLFTIGDDVNNCKRFFKPGAKSYTAKDVIEKILHG